jgi:streptogramin lyase
VQGIAAGPDGNVWFTEADKGKIGQVTAGGHVVEYGLASSAAGPLGIVTGPDGNLWFGEASGKIGRMTPSGSVMEFTIPSGAEAIAIIAAPDGKLWFTESSNGGVVNYGTCTTTGQISEHALPTMQAQDTAIAVGQDGNIWIIEGGVLNSQVARVSLSGTITEFPVPTADSNPSGIVCGPDNDIWFGEIGKIGRMSQTGTNTLEFSVPTGANQLVVGPDQNVWFTSLGSATLGRITVNGDLKSYAISGNASAITVGPDGNLWFAEPSFGSPALIGRFIPP